ncbi:putative porin [Botryobacter ruber]|uniref:putative porin n=1 Tax=Botryobacter ruber TaxID=2171629 RepID=UPI0013E3D70D|nr:putative porin [Botryobacter ruber]
MRKKALTIFLFLVALAAGNDAAAQIIDDTTKVLYGPRTTLRLYEQDVLEGRYVEQRVDTSIHNMHNERYWYEDTTYHKHLGNVATAAQPLLFRMPEKIGVRLGRNTFDRYAYDPERINYYDTRSPYSHLHYVQGQLGEQVFEAIYARNIKPNWNVGVAYKILSANKQIGPSSRGLRGDRLINNQAVKAFTHYQSPNKRYDLFANYTHMNQEHVETGGIKPSTTDTIISPDIIRYNENEIWLNQAASQEYRNNYHLLQIFKLAGEDLKLYHQFDMRRQRNLYQDDGVSSLEFYPDTLFSRRKTDDRTNYREVQNVFGVTGNSKYSFYKAYLKQRTAAMDYSVHQLENAVEATLLESDRITNLLAGGQLRLQYENKAVLQVDGEFQITKDYNVSGLIYFEGLQFKMARVLRSPSLLEQRLLSNHFDWQHNFNTSVTDRLQVNYTGKLGGRQYLKFMAHYTNIKRHIFFNEQAVPEQLAGSQRFYGGQLEHRIRFGAFHLDNFVAYTNTDQAETIRIPEWFGNSKAYLQGNLFKKALYAQLGVELHVNTPYFADDYMPVTQQFYLQNSYEVQSYPVIDVFVNADIKTVNLFLKLANATDELLYPAYFVTPGYPGMRRSFVFGLKWMFFD